MADEKDESLLVLHAYNFSDGIRTSWDRNEPPNPTPLTINWVKDKTSWSLDDEVASENESIRDETEEDEDGTGVGDEVVTDVSEENGSDIDPEDEEYMWPHTIDAVIFRLANEVKVVRFIMNKPERKVYLARRVKDDKPVIVVVGEDLEHRLQIRGIPREIRIMQALQGQSNVAQMLGWCPVDKRTFVMVLEYYQSADLIESSRKNLHIISKMIESIMLGVKQVHDCKVAHRDVAKDNVLWNPLTETATVIDFDNACFYRKSGYYRNVGRDKYDAPEKVKTLQKREELRESSRRLSKNRKKTLPYTEQAETYSIGIIFWMLLNGKHHSPDPYKLKVWVEKVKNRNKHKSSKFPELELLLRMLCNDPDRRITLDEALAHRFIRERANTKDADYERMRDEYERMRTYLAKTMADDEKEDLVGDATKPKPAEKSVDDDDEEEDESDSGVSEVSELTPDVDASQTLPSKP